MGSACRMKTNSHWQLSLVLHIHKVCGSTPIMSTPANAKEEANPCHTLKSDLFSHLGTSEKCCEPFSVDAGSAVLVTLVTLINV